MKSVNQAASKIASRYYGF